MSEELGDLLFTADVNMALTVYQRANCPEKVINCLMQKGESDKIVAYSQSVGHRVDYTFMLQQLVRTNPQATTTTASHLHDMSIHLVLPVLTRRRHLISPPISPLLIGDANTPISPYLITWHGTVSSSFLTLDHLQQHHHHPLSPHTFTTH